MFYNPNATILIDLYFVFMATRRTVHQNLTFTFVVFAKSKKYRCDLWVVVVVVVGGCTLYCDSSLIVVNKFWIRRRTDI